ncbi:hypothetical protein [Burkholderia perseverans]|uniref:hypothetical protein n=1 Tax=Burkholderia perseverans TaxID=2615214 RepID=UPI001FED3C1A|nr:hypothetical protein [Burkholderia perseverans]
MSMHLYRGFEIYPLIYPHAKPVAGSGRNYDDGFDAAVRICLRGPELTCSDTFKLNEATPFLTSGAARRASLEFAQGMIDRHDGENWMPS